MLAVIQLDAVSLPLVDELTASGQMQVPHDLRSRGDWHTLESTADHFPAAAYPSSAVSGWQFESVLNLERWSVPHGWSRGYERRLGRAPSIHEVFGSQGARPLLARSRALLKASARVGDLTAEVLRSERSDRYGEVRRRGAGKGRTGGHTADAWALVVPGASRSRVPARKPRITDIAATACAYFGVDSPGSGGEPLLEPGS